jgi:putative ABC transport system substrate-binding protein
MRRREFIALIVGMTVEWPLAARAQQSAGMRRIVLFMANYRLNDREGQTRAAAFLDVLQKLGWTDGRNIAIEYRWEAGDAERGKSSAAELVGAAPDAIVGVGSPPVLAELHRLTSTIPIVFTQISDPVEAGLVASVAHPGGNITGFTNFESAMGSKWLGVLKEVAPTTRRVGFVMGSDSVPDVAWLHAAEAAAGPLGVQLDSIDIRNGVDESAIESFAAQPNAGLIVVPHPVTVTNHGPIIKAAALHRTPALYPFRYFAAEGGLMSYGPDQVAEWRNAASYVDRILRGEQPGGLPIQAPTKFDLVINLKTAKEMGLAIPQTLLATADEVIE